MLLTKLYELSQRSDIKPKLPIEGYNQVKIRWLIEIDSEGQLLGSGFTSLIGTEPETKNGTPCMVPDLVRAAGIKPKLIADNGEYVLGIAKENVDPKKVVERHRQFKELVHQCAVETQEPSLQAVAKFLEQWQPDRSLLPTKASHGEDFDPAHNMNFRVDKTIIPTDISEIQSFWAGYESGEGEESTEKLILTCLVTDRECEVKQRLPIKIKGIPNGQTVGTSLVSANDPPFSSYGLANSLTSPICQEAAEGFGKALNYLIANSDSRFYLNNSIVYVFWTKKAINYKLVPAYKRDQPGKIRHLFESILKGKRSHLLRSNQFYALGLTASGGRAVVRDWIETTIADVMENLIRWWDAQEIVNEFGGYGDRTYFGIKSLAECLYRDPSKEAISRISTRLLHTAIQGGGLSLDILSQIVRRNRAEKTINHPRAALTKLVLSTQPKYQEIMKSMQCLNEDPKFEDPIDGAAYHCGRLLAQLERVQETALGRDVNATLIDRFYGAASTTPGKVFGGLVKDAQAHLSRIRKDKPSTYNALQQKLEEILCNISPADERFPNNLTMQQQSIFALGYYHQRAKNRQDAIAGKAAKESKAEASSQA
jgi:CRISPR-associated protein Csd1